MTDQPATYRPDIRIPVALSIVLALLELASAVLLLLGGGVSPSDDPLWLIFLFAVILTIGFALLLLLSAYLISKYKRRGLLLGLIVNGLTILAFVCSFSTTSLSLFNILALAGTLAMLVYLYRYYTQEPYKSFFT